MTQVHTGAHGRDEQLAALARAGDGHAAAELVARFERLATGVASGYYLQGGEREDLRQEARIGIVKAIRDFNPATGSSFGSFARLCIERQVITAIKTAGRVKHQALTGAVRTAKAEDADTVFDAVDVIEALNADAHELIVDHDRARVILRVIRDEMSELERTCIVGYANGESYVDTALRLGLEVRARGDQPTKSRSKTIDNALERGRRKIRLALADAEGLAVGAAA